MLYNTNTVIKDRPKNCTMYKSFESRFMLFNCVVIKGVYYVYVIINAAIWTV